MSELEPLVASYLDLISQEIVPDPASELVAGPDPYDPVWLQARLAALRSIAHAVEDLDLEMLDDEVDRTMLVDTIRLDIHAITCVIKPSTPEAITEGRLAALTAEPSGIRGTLRVLELRRAGVGRGLQGAATALGMDEALATVRAIREETESNGPSIVDGWEEEWRRSGTVLSAMGLPVASEEPPPLPQHEGDEWSYAALAVRGHAVLMLDASRAAQTRVVRQRLVAPGLLAGWGRTAAALLAKTELFALPERRLMTAYRALVENLSAEADLQLQAGLATRANLETWVAERMGGAGDEAHEVMVGVTRSPFAALSAALSHEAWQSWFADEGGEAPAFLRKALQGGGLAVRLSRWAANAEHGT